MAQSVIGALRVNLGLDSAKFEKGARRVKSPLAELKSQFKAVALAASAAGAAIVTAALAGAQEIDEAAKAARRLGTDIAGFRGLELAAAEAGVSLSSLTNDIQTMEREIASIGTSGNGKRALEALGLTLQDVQGLKADEKIALIADQVQKLGLSSGKTTAILRDLGVRNREMVLLVQQGGDAIRQARKDVDDYGLAISQVDAARIEEANDRIGRLGLIAQYAGQRLAQAIVPALGEMAEALTNSLRVGGTLRAVIDGLADNLGRLATYAATAVGLFGVRYVGALVAARVATFKLSGALAFLRGALIRTGIGALIVGVGELFFWFGKLVRGAGGFGEAMNSLYALGKAVFKGLGHTAWGLFEIMSGVSAGIAGAYVRAFSEIAKAWDLVVNGMAAAWNSIADTGFGEKLGLGLLAESDVSGMLRGVSDGMFDTAVETITRGGERIKNSGNGIAEAFSVIRDQVNGFSDDAGEAGASASEFSESLNELEGSAGGAAKGIKEAKQEMSNFEKRVDTVKTAGRTAFKDLVTGAKSFKEALGGVLQALGDIILQQAFDGLWGSLMGGLGGGGGFLGGLGSLLGFANGTDSAPGGMAMVGERGPELVNLPRGSRVNTAQETKQMLNGASSGGLIRIRLAEGLRADISKEIQGVAVETVSEGIGEYDRQLPTRVNQIQDDPLVQG